MKDEFDSSSSEERLPLPHKNSKHSTYGGLSDVEGSTKKETWGTIRLAGCDKELLS